MKFLYLLLVTFSTLLIADNVVYLIRDDPRDLNNNLFKQADFTKTEVVWNPAWEPNMWTATKNLLAKKSNYVLKTTCANKNNRRQLNQELRVAKWVIDSTVNLTFSLSLDPIKDKWILGKTIIIIYEPPVVVPANWNLNFHKRVAKILMWDNSLVDNKKYFLIHWNFYSGDKLNNTDIVSFAHKKLCCLMGEPHSSNHVKELYSPRYIAADYFEKYHPEDFDFYGFKWGHREKYKTFRKGFRGNKKAVLKNYKFCLAYENMRDVDGWITERIFNCFEAGCIPIYWGARNIRKYIPENCFIDRERFSNLNDLYNFMKNMPEAEYNQYLINIQNFLNSNPKDFSIEQFAECIATAILA